MMNSQYVVTTICNSKPHFFTNPHSAESLFVYVTAKWKHKLQNFITELWNKVTYILQPATPTFCMLIS